MRSTLAKTFVLVLAVGMVAAACSKSSSGSGATPAGGGQSSGEQSGGEQSGGGTMTINGDKANDHGTKTVSNGELEVELDQFYFSPTVIKGPAGQKVMLELKNEGSAEHNFSLTDQGIDQDVAAGEDQNVTVTIPQSGVVEFFCKFHKSLGMVGELSAA
jgi:plastocyanin